MDADELLQAQPRRALLKYQTISVPIVTVVYGGQCDTVQLLEVLFTVNGERLWYGSWPYNVPFQRGPTFSIPLEQLHKLLTADT